MFLGWFFGISREFQPGNLVAQGQPSLFQPAHHELIDRAFVADAVNQGIEIGMLHTQFDQVSLGGVKV